MAKLRATVSFHALGRFVRAGEEVESSDPIAVRYPSMFDGAASSVEQATAAPGEKRARRPRSSTRSES